MSETQESKILYIRNTTKEKKDSPLEGVDEKLAALAWENHLKRLANGYPPEKAHNLLLEELKEKQGIGPSTNPNLPIENNPHEDYLELVKYLSGPKIEEMNEKNKLLEAEGRCEEVFSKTFSLANLIEDTQIKNSFREQLLTIDMQYRKKLDSTRDINEKIATLNAYKVKLIELQKKIRVTLDEESE